MSANSAPATNTKQFHFKSKKSDDINAVEELKVSIPEHVDPHYSMYTWPSAVVLAQYVWYHRDRLKNQKIIELGAGTALPGIVAALCGANVTLSDNMLIPKSVENSRRSCQANNLELDVLGITWGMFNHDLLQLSNLDYILMSDCFYDPDDFEDILVTISFLLERNAGCKCLVTYQIRSTNWTVRDLLSKWRLRSADIPLASFDGAECDLAGSDLPGRHTIQLFEITAN